MNRTHMGIASLMRRAFDGESLEPIVRRLLRRLQRDPKDACAALDLATLMELNGDAALALEFQETALSVQQVYRSQHANNPTLKVLAIKGRGVIMDNMPLEFLLEGAQVQLESLYVGAGIAPPDEVPEHDVAIVAICESDTNRVLLHELSNVLRHWPRPVLNSPNRIANISREQLSDVVAGIDRLVFSASTRIHRSELEAGYACANRSVDENFAGWIIRPINSHAGNGLDRFSTEQELASYLLKAFEETFLVAPFIPYESADGLYRKYRIALIRGTSYPVHMALSRRWMVHYLNADMLENAVNRSEEATFMQDYRKGFGLRHDKTLRTLSDRIGLDYVVLDCAETRDGQFLLFEADNGAVVHAMDPISLFPYKRPAMDNIFHAFSDLLLSTCSISGRQAA